MNDLYVILGTDSQGYRWVLKTVYDDEMKAVAACDELLAKKLANRSFEVRRLQSI